MAKRKRAGQETSFFFTRSNLYKYILVKQLKCLNYSIVIFFKTLSKLTELWYVTCFFIYVSLMTYTLELESNSQDNKSLAFIKKILFIVKRTT